MYRASRRWSKDCISQYIAWIGSRRKKGNRRKLPVSVDERRDNTSLDNVSKQSRHLRQSKVDLQRLLECTMGVVFCSTLVCLCGCRAGYWCIPRSIWATVGWGSLYIIRRTAMTACSTRTVVLQPTAVLWWKFIHHVFIFRITRRLW